MAARAGRDVLRFSSEFGLTPSSRTRVSQAEMPIDSKFGDLLG
jgi:phage terminase small subunit